MTILKLGGSVITNKKKPLTPNHRILDVLCETIAQVHTPIVLVHGGGSFGHYYAHQFGLATKFEKYSKEGVSKTRIAMLKLNLIVIKSLEKHGVHTFSLPPSSFISSGYIARHGVNLIRSILRGGLTPVTYGDVLSQGGRHCIISGDRIIRVLAQKLRPARVVFVLDVDGVYESIQSRKVIAEIQADETLEIVSPSNVPDVTGGMKSKLEEGRLIAHYNVDVCFVNGKKPEEVLKALKGEAFHGSLIKGIGSAEQELRERK